MKHLDSANAIRLSIALRTSRSFTLAALFSELCKRTCACGELAPYLDVFTLKRRYVRYGNGFELEHVPQQASLISDLYGLKQKQVEMLPSFLSVTGRYKAGPYSEIQSRRVRMYDGRLAAEMAAEQGRDLVGAKGKVVSAPCINQDHRRLTLVLAPFLDRKTTGQGCGRMSTL